jgi:hypothetical protein
MLHWTLTNKDHPRAVVTEKKVVTIRYHCYLPFESGTWVLTLSFKKYIA